MCGKVPDMGWLYACRQDWLIENQPDTYFKPAFYGASGWVGLILDRADLDWGDVEAWLLRSWRSVAPKRLTRMLDVADEF